MVEHSKEEALKILENLGYEKFKERDFLTAIIYYERYLELNPQNAEINNTVGYVYRKIGDACQNLDKQIEYFEKAIKLKPDYIQALRNLAVTYPLVGRYQEAVDCFQKIFKLKPVIDDYVTYAYLKIRLGDFEEGWKYYEYRFIKEYMSTKYPEINKPRWEGQKIPDKTLLVQYEQGFGDTIQFVRYIEQVKPLVGKIILRVQDELVELMKDSLMKKITNSEELAIEKLTEFRHLAKKYYQENIQGQYIEHPILGKINFTAKGVKETLYRNPQKGYEFLQLKDNIKNSYYLQSEDVYHKRKDKINKFHTLEYKDSQYLIAEDKNEKKYYLTKNVLDERLPMKNRGDTENNNIIPNSNDNFNPKLEMNNIEVVGMSTALEDLSFDYHVPLLSLLYVLKARKDNIPFSKGYIKADEEKIQFYKKEFFNNDCLKIGICWNGTQFGNTRRDIPLECFCLLTKLKNTKVYAFQKNFGAEQLDNLPSDIEIIDLGKTFNDFSDTAAAMANLDLFITSDNAVFNLAGAMGKKTFVLLNKFSEWRWFLDEESIPWYDSVKIFKKQDEFESWNLLFTKVIEEIKSGCK